LGELRLRLQVLVVAGQCVVREPDVEAAIGRPIVAVEVRDVAELGGFQRAARLRLSLGLCCWRGRCAGGGGWCAGWGCRLGWNVATRGNEHRAACAKEAKE